MNNFLSNGEISLKESVIKINEWIIYLRKKWLIILLISLAGGILGSIYGYLKKTEYTADLTFALEEDRANNGGITSAIGLASSLGIDVGSSSEGVFNSTNLIELMKSRLLVEKALMNSIYIGKQGISLAQYYIEFTGLNKNWKSKKELKKVQFPINADRTKFSVSQDSILGKIYEEIVSNKEILSVFQKDKKASILTLQVRCTDELFAKTFAEDLAKEVSEFYIETKSKKARINVEILQRQADSVRAELNAAITGVAIVNDNTFNLNPAILVPKVGALKRQIDVQANTTILTQLVANLEMGKVALRRETPLIQIIDKPILPLKRERIGMITSVMIGSFICFMVCIICLTLQRIKKRLFVEP